MHGVGGWIALVAVTFLGMRRGRIRAGKHTNFAPSNIPFWHLGLGFSVLVGLVSTLCPLKLFLESVA